MRNLFLFPPHTHANAATQPRAFMQSKIAKLRNLSSSWAVPPTTHPHTYTKGHCSPQLRSHHISTITLLGTAPGHAEQLVAHNGIIVSWDCCHCDPCCRIYSPPPVLGPLTLTSANISHALGAGACEILCLPGLKSVIITHSC